MIGAPRLTDIPPHAVVINNLIKVNGHVSACSNNMVAKVKQELEDQFVRGERFQSKTMLNQVQQIQSNMQAMLANIKNGKSIGGSSCNANEESMEADNGSE